jgi:DNA-binding Lrp family transcriptional regulator
VPEVEETSVVTGASDLIVRIRCTGVEHLKAIIAEHIWSRTDLDFTETRLAFFSESSATVEQYRLDRLLESQADRR